MSKFEAGDIIELCYYDEIRILALIYKKTDFRYYYKFITHNNKNKIGTKFNYVITEVDRIGKLIHRSKLSKLLFL